MIGVTYAIEETDMEEFIKSQLLNKSDELDSVNAEWKEKSLKYADSPDGVYLPRAVTYRALEINPVYTLDENIVDADGFVIYTAGTKVNPLEIHPLTKILCFFDGGDQLQIEWVSSRCSSNPANKLIMTTGSLKRVNESINSRIYFDQRGFLTSRFEIKALPAVVRQSGNVLYMEEFPVE